MIKTKTVKQLRDKRYTYQQIGNLFSVSRQRIHQIITGYESPSTKITKQQICERTLIVKQKRKEKQREKIKLKKKQKEELIKKRGVDTMGIKLEGINFIREAVRRRDNYTCQLCNKIWKEGDRRFDVHHIDCDNNKTLKYEKLDKDVVLNMITLCHKCHLNLDEHRKSMKKGIYRKLRNK